MLVGISRVTFGGCGSDCVTAGLEHEHRHQGKPPGYEDPKQSYPALAPCSLVYGDSFIGTSVHGSAHFTFLPFFFAGFYGNRETISLIQVKSALHSR